MGRRVIALIAAALVAIFGVVAMLAYVNGADRRAVANADPQPVYITQKVVPVGTTLQAALDQELIVRTDVAAKSRPIGALSTIDDTNKNLVAMSDIGIGEYVLASRFGTTPNGNRALPVPSGMVGITMRLSTEAAVDHFITPGSKIMVFATVDVVRTVTLPPGAPIPSTRPTEVWPQTRVLLAEASVLGVDEVSLAPSTAAPTGAAAAQGGGGSIFVTVALSPDDATRLAHVTGTKLYAALMGEGAKADKTFIVDSANIESIFGTK